MTKKDAADLLDLVVEKAPALRRAGVVSVGVGDLTFELAPEELAADDRDIEPDQQFGVLDDPHTFGIQDPKAKVPGSNRGRAKAGR